MNRVWAAAVLAGAIGCGTPSPPAQQGPSAADRRGEELGYRVKWPAEPTLRDGQKDLLKTGATETHEAVADARGPGWVMTYQVSVLRFPAEKADATPPRDLIRMYLAPTAKLDQELTTKDIEFGPKKYPAVETAGERAGLRVRQLVVVAGRDLYNVTVTGTPARVNGAEGDQFLQSFEVLK
jgi:hypothetical protein